MADYIEREAAIKEFSNIGSIFVYGRQICKAIVSRINLIPAADVAPVRHGKWNRTDAYPHRLYCSVCYKTYLKNDELLERWEFPLNFCPNCGADMRGEQNV